MRVNVANRTYDIFNEMQGSIIPKPHELNFELQIHYEKYLKDGDKILDIGAGAGEYSLYFARKGYEVSALGHHSNAAFKKRHPKIKSILFKAMPLTSLDMQISRLILSFCSARFII